MNVRSVFSGLMILTLSCATTATTQAQTAKHTALSREQAAAETATRAELATDLASFQSNPSDVTLRSKILELSKSLNPAPAISQLAQDDYAKATAQMASAASTDDFETVAQMFEQVAVQAPWYADAYVNAASAYAKANEYEGARRNLVLYFAAVRPGTDTLSAEQLRRSLDHKQASQFQQALQQFNANPTDAARMHIIQLAQAMGTQPEVPEEARGHYVMAVVFGNSATESADYERAITEYKAALLTAPWWGDAYKKLAGVQTLAGRYDDAISSLIFYQAIQPTDARITQDEIYRLKALGKTAADEQAKKQSEVEQQKLLEQKRLKERAATDAMTYTVEGRWYQTSAPNDYLVGGESNSQCDYYVKQNGARWEIKNGCTPSKRAMSDVEVQPRQLSFKLKGRDPAFPFSEVALTFTLSNDGQTLEGRAVTYDKHFSAVGDHPVTWTRRK